MNFRTLTIVETLALKTSKLVVQQYRTGDLRLMIVDVDMEVSSIDAFNDRPAIYLYPITVRSLASLLRRALISGGALETLVSFNDLIRLESIDGDLLMCIEGRSRRLGKGKHVGSILMSPAQVAGLLKFLRRRKHS